MPHLRTPKKMLFQAPIGRVGNNFNAKNEKTASRQRSCCTPFVRVDFSGARRRHCYVRSDIPFGVPTSRVCLPDLCGVQYNVFYGSALVGVCDVHLAVGCLDDRRVGKLALITLKSEYRFPIGAVF